MYVMFIWFCKQNMGNLMWHIITEKYKNCVLILIIFLSDAYQCLYEQFSDWFFSTYHNKSELLSIIQNTIVTINFVLIHTRNSRGKKLIAMSG